MRIVNTNISLDSKLKKEADRMMKHPQKVKTYHSANELFRDLKNTKQNFKL